MTREEIIRNLKYTMEKHKNDTVNTFDTNISVMCKDILEYLEQEPCEDAISRQAVLASIKALYPDMPIVNIFGGRQKWLEKYAPYFECENAIEQLQPAKPPTGHWIRFKEFENGYYHIKCSECGQYWSIDGHAKIFKYCFNCGAKMEVEQNG